MGPTASGVFIAGLGVAQAFVGPLPVALRASGPAGVAIAAPTRSSISMSTAGGNSGSLGRRRARAHNPWSPFHSHMTRMAKDTADIDPEAEELFKEFDTDNSGGVDVEELRAGLERDLRKELVDMWEKKTGHHPTDEEVEAKISDMGGILPQDNVEELFALYDKDKNGVLTVDEFTRKEELQNYLDIILLRDGYFSRDLMSYG